MFAEKRHRPDCTSEQSDQHFDNRVLQSLVSELCACKITIFKLVSVAELTGLNLTVLDQVGRVCSRRRPFMMADICTRPASVEYSQLEYIHHNNH